MELKPILKKMLELEASDLHLKVGTPPTMRINGELTSFGTDPLTRDDLRETASSLMTKDQQSRFLEEKESDFGLGVPGMSRFRVNIYIQRGSIGIAIRPISREIKTIKELNLPSILEEMALAIRGLILVTGTTGSGKSTTLASMLEYLNKNKRKHIITIEDPIEYLLSDKKSIISQREIGTDTKSFRSSLRHVLRQDPDIIMIGEIRDTETMETALKAADTGHLVFSTLHTLNAPETINRIITFFPPYQHQHIRVLLSSVIKGIISLRLLPRKDGTGRIPATEILVSTPTIREYLLDEAKTRQILDTIREGEQYHMHSFDQSVMKLYKEGIIDFETALENVNNPDEFKMRLKGIEQSSKRW
ncbi:MAG: PilT/PilU family type 4a pilus ATPase [candidate division WOR-3 bacterium]|nr:PilT/PilU family type 4a pilus ATPase [candidate division WOR-3 bacterium]